MCNLRVLTGRSCGHLVYQLCSFLDQEVLQICHLQCYAGWGELLVGSIDQEGCPGMCKRCCVDCLEVRGGVGEEECMEVMLHVTSVK